MIMPTQHNEAVCHPCLDEILKAAQSIFACFQKNKFTFSKNVDQDFKTACEKLQTCLRDKNKSIPSEVLTEFTKSATNYVAQCAAAFKANPSLLAEKLLKPLQACLDTIQRQTLTLQKNLTAFTPERKHLYQDFCTSCNQLASTLSALFAKKPAPNIAEFHGKPSQSKQPSAQATQATLATQQNAAAQARKR